MNVWIVNHYAIPPSMGGLVRHYYFSYYSLFTILLQILTIFLHTLL